MFAICGLASPRQIERIAMTSFTNFSKRLVSAAGYTIRRPAAPGGHLRGIGNQDDVLADFKARGFKPGRVFDIGAAGGTWTDAVRPIFPEARFLSVEPRQTAREPAVRAGLARGKQLRRLPTGTLGTPRLYVGR